MATEETAPVHPGDIVQDTDGCLHLVTTTNSWGVGAIQRRIEAGQEVSTYARLRPGQFSVCGVAVTLPEAVAQARRDSLATEAAVAREAGQ